jgi:prepilin-type N-terminal cleavage/methylation domain-containing protein
VIQVDGPEGAVVANEGARAMQMKRYSPVKGFSMIELMVVILIIALIVAIVLPALGGARNLAKRSDTEALASQLSAAIGSFQHDNRRLPGRFTVREMANQSNLDTRGMSMAENVMLELGGMKMSDTPPVPATGWATNVGPLIGGQIWVKTDETAGKAYFTPSAKYYVAQAPGSQVGQGGHTAAGGVPQLPDLVDGFGNPLLVWLEDEATVGKAERAIGLAADAGKVAFSRMVFDPAQGPAKFYWSTNAAFLMSAALGKGAMDMTSIDPEKGNFLGGGADADRLHAMAAILGNPAFPAYPGGDTAANTDQIWPGASRGSYVIHSAGVDGTFLGRHTKKNRGASYAIGGRLYFGSAIKNAAGANYLDTDGKVTTNDFAKDFDDVVIAGN